MILYTVIMDHNRVVAAFKKRKQERLGNGLRSGFVDYGFLSLFRCSFDVGSREGFFLKNMQVGFCCQKQCLRAQALTVRGCTQVGFQVFLLQNWYGILNERGLAQAMSSRNRLPAFLVSV
jgi:hypothetical protein